MKTLPVFLMLLCIISFSCSNGSAEEKVTEKVLAPQSEQGKIDQKLIMDYVTKEGLKTSKTPSGLHFILHNPGVKNTDGVYGSDTQIVAHYHGTFLDGKVFDSSIDRGRPFKFELGSVIPGWREAIRMMGVGGKGTFLVPSNLAYGVNGYPGLIGPNVVLKFDIELLAVGG